MKRQQPTNLNQDALFAKCTELLPLCAESTQVVCWQPGTTAWVHRPSGCGVPACGGGVWRHMISLVITVITEEGEIRRAGVLYMRMRNHFLANSNL
jgi:hypothetical protein